ncbi:hypothetical protein ACA910_020734 [Epithemia clementina (nom. ined.)]
MSTAIDQIEQIDTVENSTKDFYHNHCIFEALCCVWVSCGPECGYRGQAECCCLKKTLCFEPCFCNNAKPRLLGVDCDPVDPNEICKIGLYCCDYSLVYPRVCFGIASHFLCLREVGSFPLHSDYLDHCRLGLYCISCCPKCAIAAPPPRSKAFDDLHYNDTSTAVVHAVPMDRGDEEYRPVNVKGESDIV